MLVEKQENALTEKKEIENFEFKPNEEKSL